MTRDVESLGLVGFAHRGALTLRDAFPALVFTSGRRKPTDQARAMAQNIVHSGNRTWIADTYKDTPIRLACQRWVNNNPKAQTVPQLEAGLLSVFAQVGDAELMKLSSHFTGRAFDVQPFCVPLKLLKPAAEALPGFSQFLDHEGGLVRWHIGFHEEPKTLVA